MKNQATGTRFWIAAAALGGAIVTASALAGSARADERDHHMMNRAERATMRHGERMPMMADRLLRAADELELTDAQRTKLKGIRRKAVTVLMPKRQAIVEAQMDLHDLMDESKSDASALRRAHDKVQKARVDMQNAAFDLRIEAREVLTPEQREKLRAERPKARMRMRQRFGAMGDAALPPDHEDFGALGFGAGDFSFFSLGSEDLAPIGPEGDDLMLLVPEDEDFGPLFIDEPPK